jgi:hypothetical protein
MYKLAFCMKFVLVQHGTECDMYLLEKLFVTKFVMISDVSHLIYNLHIKFHYKFKTRGTLGAG